MTAPTEIVNIIQSRVDAFERNHGFRPTLISANGDDLKAYTKFIRDMTRNPYPEADALYSGWEFNGITVEKSARLNPGQVECYALRGR
jgi:hypothetical protein